MLREEFEVEICASTIASVLAAAKGGANRVELCDNLMEGGTTPSLGTIVAAKKFTDLEVAVLIRPRGGDFIYSDIELEVMKTDIRQAVAAKADRIVIGCLNSDGTINEAQCAELIAEAQGLPITFHRAFDVTPDPLEALKTVLALGADRLLTSGQMKNALHGASLLKTLQELAGDRLRVLAGGGISEFNVCQLAEASGVRAFHGSLRDWSVSPSTYWSGEVKFNGCDALPEEKMKVTSAAKVEHLIANLLQLD